jgi:hypothetical protein
VGTTNVFVELGIAANPTGAPGTTVKWNVVAIARAMQLEPVQSSPMTSTT